MLGNCRRSRVVAVTFGLGLAVTSLGTTSGLVESAHLPGKLQDDCLECPYDMECMWFQHATATTSGGGWDGEVHGCFSSSCEGHWHKPCAGPSKEDLDAEDIAGLLAAVRGEDDDALASALRHFGGDVRFNTARQAIQVVGCGGAVIAHIPVTEAPSAFADFDDK